MEVYGGIMSRSFYHGGVNSDFTINSIDIVRPAIKQQNKNNSYIGFYVFGEENRDAAFRYAEVGNKNVVKLNMNDDLRIYELPPFTITRITKEQIQRFQDLGYDMICGKMLGKMEYVLLAKDKIESMEIIPFNERYKLDNDEISMGRSR